MSKSSAKSATTSRKGSGPVNPKAVSAAGSKAAPRGASAQKSGRRKG